LQFSQYLVIDKNMGPIDAIKKSWSMTKGHTWDLFLLLLVVIVLIAIGAALLGVGLLVTLPISTVAVAYVYRKFSAAEPAAPATQPQPAA
jgi:uncharacterized membrane protein